MYGTRPYRAPLNVYKPTTPRGGAASVARASIENARRQDRLRMQAAYRTRRQQPVVYAPAETKYFDCGINTLVTTAGSTWADTEVPCDNYVNSGGSPAAYTDCCLIPTAVGSGYGQVVGNKYKIKKIRVRGGMNIPTITGGTTVGLPGMVRMVLVMDTQPSGTQAQGEDVFQDYGADAENIFAFLRTAQQSNRYRILKDEIFPCDPTVAANNAAGTTVSTAYQVVPFSFQYVPKTPIDVAIKSGNSTPTIAGTVNCNIFLLAYGIYNTAAQGIQVNAASRCYYVD